MQTDIHILFFFKLSDANTREAYESILEIPDFTTEMLRIKFPASTFNEKVSW